MTLGKTLGKSICFLAALVLLAPLLLRLALALFLLPVERTEYAYVTRWGRHVATYDGASDAGLHWRWPWPVESVQVLDRRLQYFDLPAAELLTHDPHGQTIDRTLTLVAYVCWRITNKDEGVDGFVRRVGTCARAETLLGQRLASELGAAVGQLETDDLISVEPGKVDGSVAQLRKQLMTRLGDVARHDYGVELVDVRLRRHAYPQAVRQEIFGRIVSERNKKVADYQSQGNQLAENIRSEAARDARIIRSEALAKEQQLKGQADAEADRLRNAAHSHDVEFYAFLKKLEGYQKILGDNKTVLLLSSHRELFDLLFNPPRPTPAAGAAPGDSVTRKSAPPPGP